MAMSPRNYIDLTGQRFGKLTERMENGADREDRDSKKQGASRYDGYDPSGCRGVFAWDSEIEEPEALVMAVYCAMAECK